MVCVKRNVIGLRSAATTFRHEEMPDHVANEIMQRAHFSELDAKEREDPRPSCAGLSSAAPREVDPDALVSAKPNRVGVEAATGWLRECLSGGTPSGRRGR